MIRRPKNTRPFAVADRGVVNLYQQAGNDVFHHDTKALDQLRQTRLMFENAAAAEPAPVRHPSITATLLLQIQATLIQIITALPTAFNKLLPNKPQNPTIFDLPVIVFADVLSMVCSPAQQLVRWMLLFAALVLDNVSRILRVDEEMAAWRRTPPTTPTHSQHKPFGTDEDDEQYYDDNTKLAGLTVTTNTTTTANTTECGHGHTDKNEASSPSPSCSPKQLRRRRSDPSCSCCGSDRSESGSPHRYAADTVSFAHRAAATRIPRARATSLPLRYSPKMTGRQRSRSNNIALSDTHGFRRSMVLGTSNNNNNNNNQNITTPATPPQERRHHSLHRSKAARNLRRGITEPVPGLTFHPSTSTRRNSSGSSSAVTPNSPEKHVAKSALA